MILLLIVMRNTGSALKSDDVRKRVKPMSDRKNTTSFASTMPLTMGLKWVMKLKFETASAALPGGSPPGSP